MNAASVSASSQVIAVEDYQVKTSLVFLVVPGAFCNLKYLLCIIIIFTVGKTFFLPTYIKLRAMFLALSECFAFCKKVL